MAPGNLKFNDGSIQFRLRLAASILSHRPILIRNIRPDSLDSPGLREHEASFLRLLDKITNGTKIEINTTGTELKFHPGVLLGGEHEHECPKNGRGIGYYLEGLIPLAPFGKNPLKVKLMGITDGMVDMDPSPDYFATAIIPLLRHFGIGTDAEESRPPHLKVLRRGAAPEGGGEVVFFCPIVREIIPIDLTDVGMIKRVRGTTVSCRINPSSPARLAHAAKGLLHRLLPDVWIHTDTHSASTRKNKLGCGPSPGLSICLASESTTGAILCAEYCLDPTKDRGVELPEDLGQKGAALLLEEVKKGGYVDTSAQTTALLLMCLGPEDVSRIRIGTVNHYTIHSLRLFKEVFGVEFKVRQDDETKTILMSCLGSGYRNMARAST